MTGYPHARKNGTPTRPRVTKADLVEKLTRSSDSICWNSWLSRPVVRPGRSVCRNRRTLRGKQMSNQVYANGMEMSCKAAAGKSICAFPDVCFTPAQTPATPPGVPIPYPNTGLASDTSDGSTSVEISGQEVMLKNKSYFKKSTGDEAGSAPKKGLINSKTMGKVYFAAWSMDVMIEGENVVRHLDLTTHNHGSDANEALTWPYLDAAKAMIEAGHLCKKLGEAIAEKCATGRGYSNACCAARKCFLMPKDPNSRKSRRSAASKTLHDRKLLLNNNYHLVHHDLPGVPWFAIKGVYEASRHQYVERSGGFLVKGYSEWLGLYAFVRVAHPVYEAQSDLIQSNPPASGSFAGKLREKFMVVVRRERHEANLPAAAERQTAREAL